MSAPEPILEFALILAAAVASMMAGWLAGRRMAQRRAMLASIGFALVAWPILCNLLPDRLYFLYPAFPLGESLFGTAFFLPGVLARTYADTSIRRVLQGVLAVGVAYFVLAEPLWFLFHGEALRRVEGETRDGVTIQSGYYTCMPSSLATVLRRWGVNATEGEAAYLLQATFQGTSPTRMPRTVEIIGRERGLRAHHRYHAGGAVPARPPGDPGGVVRVRAPRRGPARAGRTQRGNRRSPAGARARAAQ